jgi:hypothetical protein
VKLLMRFLTRSNDFVFDNQMLARETHRSGVRPRMFRDTPRDCRCANGAREFTIRRDADHPKHRIWLGCSGLT